MLPSSASLSSGALPLDCVISQESSGELCFHREVTINMSCSECQLGREMHCCIPLMGEVAPLCSWQAVLRLSFGASQKTAVHVHQELLSICFHLPLDWSSILANGLQFLKLPLPYGWDSLQASALRGRWSPSLLWAWGKLVLMSAVAMSLRSMSFTPSSCHASQGQCSRSAEYPPGSHTAMDCETRAFTPLVLLPLQSYLTFWNL